MNIVAVTGHRPNKLGGYDKQTRLMLEGYARRVIHDENPDLVITGMALGWDQAVGQACVDLTLPFVAALPFATHGDNWPAEARSRYDRLLQRARSATRVWEIAKYRMLTIEQALDQRNWFMVDQCSSLLALYNGEKKGGTANCVRYAKLKDRMIVNVWHGLDDYRARGEWLI